VWSPCVCVLMMRMTGGDRLGPVHERLAQPGSGYLPG
jgi:hypothetical protein